MKRTLTLLLTFVSFFAFSQQFCSCELQPNHYHCTKQMQKAFVSMEQNVQRLQTQIDRMQARKQPPQASCWIVETILDNSPDYIVNENISKFRYVKDSCMVFLEYRVVLHLSTNQAQFVFDLPVGIIPHHDIREQADLIFDANFETAIVLVHAITNSIIFRRQDGNFYNNPNSVEINGRFFMQWQ